MFKLQVFLMCLLISCEINAQLISYKPGQNAYNLLNIATGGLTEALTGGSRLFNYEWGNLNSDKTDTQTNPQSTNNQQPQTNNQQEVVNYQQPQTNYLQPQTNYVQPQNNFQQARTNYIQPQSSFQQSSSCNNFFSYRTDQNEKFAIVTLPNPNYVKNELKVQMTLAAQVSVRKYCCRNFSLCKQIFGQMLMPTLA